MVTTYKYKSKIATAIAFIAAFIVYIGKDELAKLLPPEYAFIASFLVILAGYILAQSTENKRVNVAELLVESKYNETEDVDPASEYETLNDEYTTGDADDDTA